VGALCRRGASNTPSPSNPAKQTARNANMQDSTDGSITFKPIGVVRSIYRLCVGTPRQGLLAPDAHGRIELHHLDTDVVDELQCFSHICVVFCFHLNTTGKRETTKIAPPALGGRKIGVLASRSPHRPNPIGMTLCKLDGIEIKYKASKQQKKPKRIVCLMISGIDLVDGTPVLDIKPYVPAYDAPLNNDYFVPSWVSQGLATQRPVSISDEAHQQLESILKQNSDALEFYHGPDAGPSVLRCIQQVLSMDVRSSYQTQKARQGKSQAERAKRIQEIRAVPSLLDDEATICTQQLDNLLIHFTVTPAAETSLATSNGSGAEDLVLVTRIELLDRLDG
jgi:tRNA-Thr(GGU) m(6)t(6)A37 methyltransferase TsaA